MDAPEVSADEVTRLRSCLNDLGSIIALPAVSAGGEPSQIVSTLVDALLGMLHLAFVFVRLNDPEGGPPIEMMRVADSMGGTDRAREIREAIDSPLGDAPPKSPSPAAVSVGDVDLSVASARLGLDGEIGILVAASQKRDFPAQTERLLLDVAAIQATIGLQQAHLTEQRRVARGLDERVAQRTSELAIGYEALRESERESRLIVDSIPGLVATFTPAGEVEFVNRQVLEYYGKTSEELKRWETTDATHPEDLPRVVELFTHSIASGDPFEFEVRTRRVDGVYRWFQSRGFPLRDTNGHIVRWYNLLIDIDERKRAEEALAASERNLKLIIDTMPALAWSARPDGSADFFNQHYLEFMGLSAQQASDWGWTVAVHPDDLKGLAAIWQQVLASEQRGEAEARLRRHDGEYRWFLFRVDPLRDERGIIVKWYGVNTDIEDRKRAEDKTRLIIDTALDAVITMDARGMVTTWNKQAETIFGWSHEEAIGQRLSHMIIPEQQRAVHERGFHHFLATGEGPILGRRIEVTAVRRGGVEFPVELEVMPMRLGQDWVFSAFLRDITDAKLAEEKLRESELKLRHTQAKLAHVTRVTTVGELTASITHEINQPLSGIITNASTCLRMLAADPPNVDGALETARRTIRDGNRASDVITRLRALFSKRELALEPLDLNEATREVISLSSGDLQRNRIILRLELADDLLIVTGDRIQLQQVILNLLRNASDAMVDVHDRPRQLLIKTERDGDRVRLTVRDAGVGLPPQSLDSLFDAFYTTKSGGMGIGLFVSRSIVERHHGHLWAEPNDGPGATFSLSIPFQTA